MTAARFALAALHVSDACDRLGNPGSDPYWVWTNRLFRVVPPGLHRKVAWDMLWYTSGRRT